MCGGFSEEPLRALAFGAALPQGCEKLLSSVFWLLVARGAPGMPLEGVEPSFSAYTTAAGKAVVFSDAHGSARGSVALLRKGVAGIYRPARFLP